jgi:hypothetical protein
MHHMLDGCLATNGSAAACMAKRWPMTSNSADSQHAHAVTWLSPVVGLFSHSCCFVHKLWPFLSQVT